MTEFNPDRQSLVLFRIEDRRYALRLDAVERVIQAVAVTPMPEMPAFALGLINLAGQLLPVFSLRRCLGVLDRALRPEDQFVIVHTSRLTLVLVVDEVQGLSDLEVRCTVVPGEVLPGVGSRVRGLVKIEGEIVLVYDLEQLFNPENQDRILQAKAMAETSVS